MKYVLIFLTPLILALTGCSSQVSNVEVAKAQHACRSKGSEIDYISTKVVNTVICTDGKSYNLADYNPHKNDN